MTIGKEFLGFAGNKDPEKTRGKKHRELAIEKMVESAVIAVNDGILSDLRKDFMSAMGTSAGWQLEPDLDAKDGQTLLYYPAVTEPLQYVKPAVRIEFGSRSDVWPSETHMIRPYAAESFPAVFRNPEAQVTVLSAERTFWEKATILHQEAHRPEESMNPMRYSRHYYDLAMISKTPICERAINDTSLLNRVVEHKKMFFRCGWANYDMAVPGSLSLVPPKSRLAALKDDYARMSPMMFGESPLFQEIITELETLEGKINNGGRAKKH